LLTKYQENMKTAMGELTAKAEGIEKAEKNK
jgi:hypothetical protein